MIGGVTMFHGRVSTVDSVGRTQAQITVASDLVILDYDMPHNSVLGDLQPCALRLAVAASSVEPIQRMERSARGSTARLINTSVALAGACARLDRVHLRRSTPMCRATVKSAVAGTSLTLMYPLPSTPSAGDAFTVYLRLRSYARNMFKPKFNNLSNFRGFPFVPPPQIAY